MGLRDIFNSSARDGHDQPGPAADSLRDKLKGVDLSHVPSFGNADLSGANLRGADLRPLSRRQEERTRARRLWALKKHRQRKS